MCTYLPWFRRANQEGDFSFRRIGFERLQNSRQFPAPKFFVQFRHFPRQARGPISQYFERRGHGIGYPMRCLVEDQCAILNSQALQRTLAFSRSWRQETKKYKLLIRSEERR